MIDELDYYFDFGFFVEFRENLILRFYIWTKREAIFKSGMQIHSCM